MTDEKSAESVMPLKIGDFVEGKGVYAGVLYDENGENPKSLFVAMKDAPEEMDWNTAMAQDYGKYHLPDIRELIQIHLYKDAINAGLKKNGGAVLQDEYYWSSTEVYLHGALIEGERFAWDKDNSVRVRPVVQM